MTDQPQPAAATTKPVKLRESCDTCLTAKVKCSKDRPVCRRCLGNGAPCFYSPSSRSGKRSNANRNSNGVTKAAETSKPRESRPSSPKMRPPMGSIFGAESVFPLERDPNPLDGNGIHPLQNHQDMNFEPTNFSTEIMGVGDPMRGGDQFLPIPPYNQADFLDSFMPILSPGNFNAFSPAPPSPKISGEDSIVGTSEKIKETPPNGVPDGVPNVLPRSLDTMPAGQSSPSSIAMPPQASKKSHIQQTDQDGSRGPKAISQTCDCFAACLQVLQSLHNHSWLLSSTDQGGPRFDIVLTINKEAIESCSTMLECAYCLSKSGKSIATMMLATIFGKVMSLYRAACILRFGSANSTHSTAQLAFGAYTVTGENRHLLEIEILLLELRRVASVLVVYSERLRTTQTEKDDESTVYNALTAYLGKNLRYIVQFLNAQKSGIAK